MEAYTSFAKVYDQFMDNVPYEDWAQYLHGVLEMYGIRDGLVLELGCGTGTMTELLSGYGYDMIGVDCSEEMLDAAMEKREESGHDILYLLQDMREFELYGTVKAVVCVCDSLNYVTEQEDLLQVFRLVNNYLDPGGIFIFDLNTLYKYEEILGNCTIAEDREEASFIWENEFDQEERLNIYQLSLFQREESGLYSKHQEVHYQKAYELEEVIHLLEKAGMEYMAAYDAFTRNPTRKDSERIYVLARESGKA